MEEEEEEEEIKKNGGGSTKVNEATNNDSLDIGLTVPLLLVEIRLFS